MGIWGNAMDRVVSLGVFLVDQKPSPGARHLGSREVGEAGRSWHRFLGAGGADGAGFGKGKA